MFFYFEFSRRFQFLTTGAAAAVEFFEGVEEDDVLNVATTAEVQM